MTVFDRRVCLTRTETQIDRPVRGVIFDLDGVITDTARFHYAAWKQIADELGIPFDEEFNERFKAFRGRSAWNCCYRGWRVRNETQEEKTALTSRKNAYMSRRCQL